MRRLCVIGDPVAHSLSPAIQQAALRAAGIEGTYEAVRIQAGGLHERWAELRADFTGCNVTTPLKEEAAALCDRLDGVARAAGAANTLSFGDDAVVGWNTDGEGAAFALAQACGAPEARGLRVAVLGTGPAARAAVLGLAAHGACTLVWGRRSAGVDALAALDASVRPWSYEPVDGVLSTLPPGAVLPADLAEALRRSPVIVDANYGERADLGERLGRAVRDGLGMLIGQAAASFRLWFGVEPDVATMARAVNFRLRARPA
ncbi:shikimate dehydrogenase [bacterium]|nr:MAG: shikimate dehydrogenase [bacterium]